MPVGALRRSRGRGDARHDAAEVVCRTGIVRVRNNSGFALPRFAVLALSEPIIGPLANVQEFKNKVNFEGGTPTTRSPPGDSSSNANRSTSMPSAGGSSRA